MIEAHIPLSGYNIIFQWRTDYFSMEGKWLGENPSTNPKWDDSGLKEPACFSFPPPPSPFSLPTLKAKQQLEADSSEPCTIPHSLFRHMQPLQHNERGRTNIVVDISYFLSVLQRQGFIRTSITNCGFDKDVAWSTHLLHANIEAIFIMLYNILWRQRMLRQLAFPSTGTL